jgi:glutamine amidotransferase-like uncharacterized protein
MPGANMYRYYQNLGSDGMNKIKEYISRGGGYIGICGGAYFAASTCIWRGWSGEQRKYNRMEYLGIFNGTADGPIEDFAPLYYDENCKVTFSDKQHPLAKGLPDTIQYLYAHGPGFILGNNQADLVFGKAVKENHALMLYLQYHNGRIFLTSGHPEATNSYHCRLLLLNAIVWCSKQN